MEMYVLKSALCLAIFFAFYKTLLESTSVHVFKRFYLLGALLLSVGIPLITFTTYVEIPAGAEDLNSLAFLDGGIVKEAAFNWSAVLWSVYGLGVLYFGIRFCKNLHYMFRKIRFNPKERTRNIITVFLNEKIVPHTFFRYIFLNRKRFEDNSIPREVMDHEITHARELHSIDIILVEIMAVIFWFNPLLHYYKHSVKLNHEFLADNSVLRRGVDTTTYQKILLAYSSDAGSPILANAINYSFIKKRFKVMKANTSKKAMWVRTLLLLPIITLTLLSFSGREEIPVEREEIPIETEINSTEDFVQTSASREEMKEYNKLARKYNNMSKDNMFIKKKELNRMEYIYQKMSPKQRADAEPFPNIPPPPPPPNVSDAPEPVKVIKGVNDTDDNIPPPPPPPPAPDAPIIDFSEEILQGATFYLNDKKISTAKAKEIVKDSDAIKTVRVVEGKNGKPEVRIWNK